MAELFLNRPGVVIGILIMFFGLAAGRWPQSVSTIHYTSPERRKNVDLHKLRIHVMAGLILLGLLVIGLDFLICTDEVRFVVRFVVIITGVLLTLCTTRRYDHNI